MTILSSIQASNIEAWSLNEWLDHLSALHPKNIEMGLERVAEVYQRLGISFSAQTVVTVAGTNGKGTTCALLEQACLTAGKRVGVYSSPHLIHYTERVRIQGNDADEQAHCRAFQDVERARREIPLTYFEFGTLAGLKLIHDANVEVALLEVGLGGRLDAVNVVSPDIAVITSIDLDHQDWLGDTKELVAAEKAGIMREGIPVVIGEPVKYQGLVDAVTRFHANAYWQHQDFDYNLRHSQLDWHNTQVCYTGLPVPHIPVQNVSTGLQVIQLLELELTETQLSHVIESTRLPGRCQTIGQFPTVMVDVAHNPHATAYLLTQIRQHTYNKLYVVVGMLKDKDIRASLANLVELNAQWMLGSLDMPRGATASDIKSVLDDKQKVLEFDSTVQAYQQAKALAHEHDLIVVFGSFFTVSDILKLINEGIGE
ncbi:bifunctional tetrahydrofolate synthase/dihydrofolate synthase [uncultured Paraglaciecola sp.]|uniref:bifunctional tetrahydrofolate synthase/dihydrofolate synthase n=1 Tax=uncultured Paraglaciecola sp. TaxID=1765024 RepID=UPI0030D76845|tara:strand:- start:2593 stop:3873 length:1281 start_codon:yes stop_codon:yes gene_type:complete